MGRSLPDFLLWRKGAYRAVQNRPADQPQDGGDTGTQVAVDPSERPVDPSERPVARAALAAQMARMLTPGARVNPPVSVVSQPSPAPPVPLPPVSDPSKPDAGGAYLTRQEAGSAPQMTGARPALQHNQADATRADAL